jgi:hypothetical protein
MQRDPILLRETRFNYLPARFIDRGMERRVKRVERRWDVRSGWRQPAGRYFRVRCSDGSVCDLFHDVALNAWYIKRGLPWLGLVASVVFGKAKLRWELT